jgi:xylulokinase
MSYVAAFDLGTTAVKGVLISEERKAVFRHTLPLETLFSGDYKEQNPRDWYDAFCGISRTIFENGFSPKDIRGIIMSGQMQDLIPVDEKGNPLRNAILYSDGRAVEEAAYINSLIGEDSIRRITGNAMDASIPAAKLLWYKKHEESNYHKTVSVLGSSKDYVILRLCGKMTGDITSASTFGLMDIHEKRWDDSLLNALAIPPHILPELFSCGDQAGSVSKTGVEQTGFLQGTPVYAGSGDAGASTLSSGITRAGEYSIYLGTSGWIAAISKDILSRPGVFNLAAIPPDLYINVVPFLNAGGVHKWVSGLLWSAESGLDKYDYIDSLLENSAAGSGGLLFLPYLSGERFPVMDPKIRGAYIGIDNETTRSQMARACLEGVAFSIRQGLEAISQDGAKKISLTGGGAKTPVWRQILADVLNSPITQIEDSSEYLPSIALSGSVFINMGLAASHEEFAASLGDSKKTLGYDPSKHSAEYLDAQYRRYLKIYPAVKNLF